MLYFLIISDSPVFLSLRKNALIKQESVPEETIFLFRYDQKANEQEEYEKRLEEYDRLFNSVNETILSRDPVHNRFIGIVDCMEPGVKRGWKISALSRISGMMILSFPEILWLPAYYDDGNKLVDRLGSPTMDLKTAIALCQGGYTPLFDGDGLRGILLSRARYGEKKKDIRRDVAFSIDEEPHFAYMNTYTAFRFGYRGFPVMTARCAKLLLGAGKDVRKDSAGRPVVSREELRRKIPCALDVEYGSPDSQKSNRPLVDTVVVFEDICLNFPDSNRIYAEDFIPFGVKRDKQYPMIADADLRVIATSTPRNERVANIGEERSVTLNEYFGKYCSNYRSVACHSRKWSKQIMFGIKKIYTIFWHQFLNRTGNWWGYGLINALAMGFSIFTLGYLFLIQRFYLFSLCLLIIYFWFSIREWISQLIIQHMSRHVAPGRSFFFKRLQWPFMPKYYISYAPISYENKDPGIHFWEEAHKPHAGIFDFRNICGLPNGTGFRGAYNNSAVRQFYRNAIRKGVFSEGEKQDNSSSHASRGTSLDIAMRLIRRAEQMKDSIVDVEGAVHAAVLSDVALELLDHKTPATSMEALQWKHYYEILAECEFVGVRAHMNIEDRYIDIHNAMGKICRINRRVVRKDVFISGMAEIIDKLVDLLKSKGKLEEAAYFTAHSRRLHRKLLFTPVRAFLAYPEWVLRTKWNFLISFGCFFVLFFLYWFFVVDAPFYKSVMVTCKVMLARIQEDSSDPSVAIIVMLARQVAILHLCFVAARFLMFMDRK